MRIMAPDKKLELKSELIRHLNNANDRHMQGDTSSAIKVLAISLDLVLLEDRNVEPDLTLWRDLLEPKPSQGV